MSEIVDVHSRYVRDLTTPTELPAEWTTFKQVKFPAGNFPVPYIGCEALTLGQIKTLFSLDSDLEDKLSKKADSDSVYTKDETYSKTENNQQLSKKADVVSVYTKEETYTKNESNNLLAVKANQSYVDAAIGAVNTDASKQYATLALANANIANIPLNKIVFVSEEANGGYWYKESEASTSLTKSPYDPLSSSKNYTDQKTAFWQVSNMNVQMFDAFSEYSVGFVGQNGKMPLGIKKDGTVVSEKIEAQNLAVEEFNANEIQAEQQSIAGMKMQALDPFSGYVFGIGNGAKYPIALRNDGTIEIDKLKVNRIDLPTEETESEKFEKASQEWWIYPVHTYTEKPYPRVISGVYGEDGSIYVGEYVIGRGITRKVKVGQTALIDDHNAPSVFIKENRRSIVMWQNHDKTQYLSAKVSTKDGDISTLEFAAEQQIPAGVNISYTQLHHIESESTETEDIFYIFSRFAQTAWGFTKISVNQETGVITTLDQHKILTAGAQYYMTSTLADNKLRIASYYNPANSLNQIHYWEIDLTTGDLTNHLGGVVGNIISHANLPVDITTATPVLAHNASIDRRMFYVRSLPMSPAILYLEWTAGQLQDTGNYKVTALENGSWVTRTYAPSGKPFYSSYFSGASFPDPCLKDEIIVCRYDNANNQGVLERVINDNETMITIESDRVDGEHLIRPMTAKNGGNLCTYVQLHAYATTSTFSFESDVNFIFLK